MTAIRIITPPTVMPLTLEETKTHLRVDHSDDDERITAYIAAATAYVDGEYGFLGRALVTQTWELVLDTFPTNEIRIPLPPTQSIESVKYDDSAGIEITMPSTDYTADLASEPAWILPPANTAWPTVFTGINSVRIRFVAGYPASTDSPPDLRANIPASIKQAMLLQIGSWYDHREDHVIGTTSAPVPNPASLLLRPHRVVIPFA
jgi:uncharacterized phiE125 gp8 family phage protein